MASAIYRLPIKRHNAGFFCACDRANGHSYRNNVLWKQRFKKRKEKLWPGKQTQPVMKVCSIATVAAAASSSAQPLSTCEKAIEGMPNR